MTNSQVFDASTQERLGFYVYALFHPDEPNWPFYIGKGKGNRVFAHAEGVSIVRDGDDDVMSLKMETIAEIKRSGREVGHTIVRYGLTKDEALLAESCLIDMVNHVNPDCLTNEISGHGSAEGFRDARDLIFEFSAEELETEVPVVLIKIERRWNELTEKYGAASKIPDADIYEATRGNWRISIDRAKKARYMLAVSRGLVRGCFVANDWEDSRDDGRKRFSSSEVAKDKDVFVGKSVARIFGRGEQNPIRYLNL